MPPRRSICRGVHERLLGKLVGPLAGLHGELENSMGRSSAGSHSKWRLGSAWGGDVSNSRYRLWETAGHACTPRSRDAAPNAVGIVTGADVSRRAELMPRFRLPKAGWRRKRTTASAASARWRRHRSSLVSCTRDGVIAADGATARGQKRVLRNDRFVLSTRRSAWPPPAASHFTADQSAGMWRRPLEPWCLAFADSCAATPISHQEPWGVSPVKWRMPLPLAQVQARHHCRSRAEAAARHRPAARSQPSICVRLISANCG